jgi:EpsI family protein
MRVNRACMQKGGVRMLTYYWFPQRGRNLTSLYQLKLFTFWNAMTSRRTDGALVRVITPVYETERLADADARLQGFTRELSPVLATFLPR